MFLVCFELDALLCGWGLGSLLVSSKVCTKYRVFLENIWNSLATSPELEEFKKGMVYNDIFWKQNSGVFVNCKEGLILIPNWNL